MNGLHLQQVLEKMLKAEVAKGARIQVSLPDGKYYDITSLQLLENKIILFSLGINTPHDIVPLQIFAILSIIVSSFNFFFKK